MLIVYAVMVEMVMFEMGKPEAKVEVDVVTMRWSFTIGSVMMPPSNDVDQHAQPSDPSTTNIIE